MILMYRGVAAGVSLLVAVALSGCSPARHDDDGRVSIAASFYPLAWLSEQVAPGADVTDLTRPGLEPTTWS
jgi:zinc transport system substrate-binding protein